MTTNPTPLTAEDAEYQNMKKQKEAIEAKQGVCLTGVTHSIYDQIVDEQGKRDEECLLEDIDNKLLEFAEAYAAQQNAELVAELKQQAQYIESKVTQIEAFKAENERLKQQLAWQPIETAPKDGTSVLIFDNYREDKKVDGYNRVVARFDEPLDRWMIHQRYGNYIACINPTKWMPLPQPPKEGE